MKTQIVSYNPSAPRFQGKGNEYILSEVARDILTHAEELTGKEAKIRKENLCSILAKKLHGHDCYVFIFAGKVADESFPWSMVVLFPQFRHGVYFDRVTPSNINDRSVKVVLRSFVSFMELAILFREMD